MEFKIMFLSHFRALRSPHGEVRRVCVADNSNKKPEEKIHLPISENKNNQRTIIKP